LSPIVEEMQKEEEKVKESVETEKYYDEKKEEIRSIMKGKTKSREKPRELENESFQLKKTLDEVNGVEMKFYSKIGISKYCRLDFRNFFFKMLINRYWEFLRIRHTNDL
jgi:predicted nuclease with TOPRIM domain